jgi:enoyl-CoA hydratase
VARQVDASLEDGIATVVLNQPARRNAMSLEMWQQLGRIVKQLDGDASTRVTIIRGAGHEAFSAGADITEFEAYRSTPEKALSYNAQVAQAMESLYQAQKPILGLIHGFCVGGGCEIALGCDMRFASEQAVFGVPAARLGISYGHADIKRLVDIVGPANARYIFFTADPRIPARRAFEMGLVNELWPSDQLDQRVYSLARQIGDNSPASIRWAKQAIEVVLRDPGLASVPDGDEQAAQLFGGDDYREGIAAFLEKRKPDFRWQ